jgi:hypothetical protein
LLISIIQRTAAKHYALKQTGALPSSGSFSQHGMTSAADTRTLKVTARDGCGVEVVGHGVQRIEKNFVLQL